MQLPRGVPEPLYLDEDDRPIVAVGQSKALTSGNVLPLWQVPLSLLESAARRYQKGIDKGYPIFNWRSGLTDPIFLRDRSNHAVIHFLRFLNGDTSVDTAQGNIDAIVFWCTMMCEALKVAPEVVTETFYADSRNETQR